MPKGGREAGQRGAGLQVLDEIGKTRSTFRAARDDEACAAKPPSHPPPKPPTLHTPQEDKVAKAVANYEPAVREVDVRLSVAGGDAGKGARAQRAEVTIYTARHGVIRVEDAESTAYAALDIVCDKVRAKLRRVKEKAIAVGRWPGAARPRGAAKLAPSDVEASSDDGEDFGDEFVGGGGVAAAVAPEEEVLREKAFVAARMTIQAAVDGECGLGVCVRGGGWGGGGAVCAPRFADTHGPPSPPFLQLLLPWATTFTCSPTRPLAACASCTSAGTGDSACWCRRLRPSDGGLAWWRRWCWEGGVSLLAGEKVFFFSAHTVAPSFPPTRLCEACAYKNGAPETRKQLWRGVVWTRTNNKTHTHSLAFNTHTHKTMPFRQPARQNLLPTTHGPSASRHRGRAEYSASELDAWRSAAAADRDAAPPPGERRWLRFDGEGRGEYVEVSVHSGDKGGEAAGREERRRCDKRGSPPL